MHTKQSLFPDAMTFSESLLDSPIPYVNSELKMSFIACFSSVRSLYTPYCERSTSFDTTVAFYISDIGNPSVAILPTDSSIVKLSIFEVIRTQNVLTYERYLCCLQ